MKSLAETKANVLCLAQQHGLAEKHLPTFGYSRGAGYPHVEVCGCLYHHVSMRQGQESARKTTPDYEDLLYWVFSDATYGMALMLERRNDAQGVQGRDSRLAAFQTQLDLLARISLPMAARKARELAQILTGAPCNDAPFRVNRI